jgi:hypothetical protein
MDDRPSAFTFASSLAKIAFVTAGYYLVGMLPEQNHWLKGDAWARIGAYRWAAWHFRKYLKYSDDSAGRMALGWCYLNLRMPESAVEHLRLAYHKDKRPEYGCYLAQGELDVGNLTAARSVLAEISARRQGLGPDLESYLSRLESKAGNVVSPTSVPPDAA